MGPGLGGVRGCCRWDPGQGRVGRGAVNTVGRVGSLEAWRDETRKRSRVRGMGCSEGGKEGWSWWQGGIAGLG